MWYLVFVNCCGEASVSDVFETEEEAEAALEEADDPWLSSEECYYITDEWHGKISPLVFLD